jgi:hypothetical protein
MAKKVIGCEKFSTAKNVRGRSLKTVGKGNFGGAHGGE